MIEIPVPSAWRALIPDDLLAAPRAALTADAAAGLAWHPDPGRILRALSFFPPQETRVVILGQDPYPTAGHPTGLAFDLPAGAMSPSARNILAEVEADLGAARPDGARLHDWARQGVLLWNSALTTRVGEAGAHARIGWHRFTAHLLAGVCAAAPGCVFICWGAHARRLVEPLIPEERRPARMVCSNHPSPLSARRGPVPFIGSRPFSAANRLLAAAGIEPVDWVGARR